MKSPVPPNSPAPRSRFETAFAKYGAIILISYLIIGISGGLLLDTEIGGAFTWLFRSLGLPIILGFYVLAQFGLPAWRGRTSTIGRILWPGVVALIFLLMSGGFVDYANALFADGSTVQLRGPITKLNWSSGRSGKRYYLVLADQTTHRAIKLQVPHQEYIALKIGDPYERTMKKGGLGYAYQWK